MCVCVCARVCVCVCVRECVWYSWYKHHSSLLLHYSFLSYILLSISRYPWIYCHSAGLSGLLLADLDI